MTRIGFVGLGTLGAPMALSAGGWTFLFFLREEVMSEFRVAGATACATCAEVAKSSDVVITILTADEQVEQVMLGQNGVIEGAGDGMLLIEPAFPI